MQSPLGSAAGGGEEEVGLTGLTWSSPPWSPIILEPADSTGEDVDGRAAAGEVADGSPAAAGALPQNEWSNDGPLQTDSQQQTTASQHPGQPQEPQDSLHPCEQCQANNQVPVLVRPEEAAHAMCPANAKDRTSQIAQILQVIKQHGVCFKKCMCTTPLWSFWWPSCHPGKARAYRKFFLLNETRSQFHFTLKKRLDEASRLVIKERNGGGSAPEYGAGIAAGGLKRARVGEEEVWTQQTGDGNGGGSSKRARENITGAAEGGRWGARNVNRTGETDRSLATPPPASRSPVQGGGAEAGTPSVLSVDHLRDFGLQDILSNLRWIPHLLKWFLERERSEQMSRRASSSEENERWAELENLINKILRKASRELDNPGVCDKLLDDVFGALKLTLLGTPYTVSSGGAVLETVQDVLAYAFEKATGKPLTSKCSLTNVFSY